MYDIYICMIYICIYIYIYVYIYNIHIYVYLYICIRIHLCKYTCVHTFCGHILTALNSPWRDQSLGILIPLFFGMGCPWFTLSHLCPCRAGSPWRTGSTVPSHSLDGQRQFNQPSVQLTWGDHEKITRDQQLLFANATGWNHRKNACINQRWNHLEIRNFPDLAIGDGR